MDPQQIKTLMDAMASSDLSEMEFSQDGWTLRLVRHADASPKAAQPELQRVPRAASSQSATASIIEATPSAEVVAPLYGVVHLQAAPGEPPFVVKGQEVKAGQTLCVIEAMKVFNEVRAERDGIVQAVLVESGQEVEAGQALLRYME